MDLSNHDPNYWFPDIPYKQRECPVCGARFYNHEGYVNAYGTEDTVSLVVVYDRKECSEKLG